MWLFCAIRTASHGTQQKMGVGEQSRRSSLEDNLEGGTSAFSAVGATQFVRRCESHTNGSLAKSVPRSQTSCPTSASGPGCTFSSSSPPNLSLHRSFMQPPMRGCNDCRPRSALLEIPTWQREKVSNAHSRRRSPKPWFLILQIRSQQGKEEIR